MPGVPAAIALGSNLGDREAELHAALRLIDAIPGFAVAAVSSIYDSAPWGDTDQGPFINAVAVGVSHGDAPGLLDALRRIEVFRGKRVVRANGPRCIDLDLLAHGSDVFSGEQLTLPHPRAAHRPFVYRPLAECLAVAGPEFARLAVAPSDAGRAIEADTSARPRDDTFPSSAPVIARWESAISDPDAMHALARELAPTFAAGGTIAATGTLGAGKSEFARALLRTLGVTGPIPSPTFTLCREYALEQLDIQHWDFYRLSSPDELESAGWDFQGDRPLLRVIEWADRFPELLPDDALRIDITPTGDTTRLVSVTRAAGVPLVLRARR